MYYIVILDNLNTSNISVGIAGIADQLGNKKFSQVADVESVASCSEEPISRQFSPAIRWQISFSSRWFWIPFKPRVEKENI